MFGNEPRDLARALTEMEMESRAKTRFDQVAQTGVFRGFLESDRRFDGYDHGRLIERVREARNNGRSLDLDDPYLQRGGSKRPLSF